MASSLRNVAVRPLMAAPPRPTNVKRASALGRGPRLNSLLRPVLRVRAGDSGHPATSFAGNRPSLVAMAMVSAIKTVTGRYAGHHA